MAISIGSAPPLFQHGKTAQQVFTKLAAVIGVDGNRVYGSQVPNSDGSYEAQWRYVASTIHGEGTLGRRVANYNEDTRNGEAVPVSHYNLVASNQIFKSGDTAIYPIGQIWEALQDNDLSCKFEISSSALPALPSTNWRRLDGVSTCDAPHDPDADWVFDAWDKVTGGPTSAGSRRVDGGGGFERNTWRSRTEPEPVIASDYWRSYRSTLGDAGWPAEQTPWSPFPPQGNRGFMPYRTGFGGRPLAGQYDSIAGYSGWEYIDISNRWKWMIGKETAFENECLVTWDPSPDKRIECMQFYGLRNVTSIQIDCINSAGTRRFRRTVTVSSQATQASDDFSSQSTVASDRYEIRFTGSDNAGFSTIGFGDFEVLSESATLQPGSRLGLFDYSDKNAAGTDVVMGRYFDDYDFLYHINTAEDVALHEKLSALQGEISIFNLSDEYIGIRGFIRNFEIQRMKTFSRLRLRIEGVSSI